MATNAGVAEWGVSDTSATQGKSVVSGIVTEIQSGVEYIMAPESNEIGSVVKQTVYDEHYTCSFTVEVAAGTNLPDSNKTITVNGRAMYVKSAELAESNSAYRKINVTAEGYKHCGKTENKINAK